jgi:transcriptional regulator with XRE-family HTH domain
MREKKSSFIGDHLRRLRNSKGWSQQKLAEEARLSFTVISKVEQGVTTDPSISSLVKIADALGVTLDEVVGRTPPRRSSKMVN